ncbi:MAG: aminoglycoside phosphotransferase family protein [Thermoplasmata archaeon]
MRDALPPTRSLRSAARAAWPDEPLRRFRVDHHGWTNLVLEANGAIIFRFPRRVDVARNVGVEVRLLEFLGRHLSTPIPRPVRISTLGEPVGWPFIAYRKLPGTPLRDLESLSGFERTRLRRFLTTLFSDLSRLPPGPLRHIGIPFGDRVSWRQKYERLRRRYRRTAANLVPVSVHRELTRLFDAFSETLARSRFAPVLLHNDLWPSHILWDQTSHRPTGVIDWEDARFGDPVFDLTTLRALGARFARSVMRGRDGDRDATWGERLLFYQRIEPLQGLLFGLETNRTSIVRTEMRKLRISVQLDSLTPA